MMSGSTKFKIGIVLAVLVGVPFIGQLAKTSAPPTPPSVQEEVALPSKFPSFPLFPYFP